MEGIRSRNEEVACEVVRTRTQEGTTPHVIMPDIIMMDIIMMDIIMMDVIMMDVIMMDLLAAFPTIRREGAPTSLRPPSHWEHGRHAVLAGNASGGVAPASVEGLSTR